jgi:hypothetical protein
VDVDEGGVSSVGQVSFKARKISLSFLALASSVDCLFLFVITCSLCDKEEEGEG